MPKFLRESTGLLGGLRGSIVELTLITPGKGSSGNYDPKVLEQAAKDRVFPKGTQSHIDHDSFTMEMDRPEGSLRNLAGVLMEDARWEPNWVDEDGTKGRLVANARIGEAWQPFIRDFGGDIGVSIVSAAEVADNGDVLQLLPNALNRADFVTVAGRGGKITEVLESYRAKEATANTTRELLSYAVKASSVSEYAWLRDYDDTYVYYEAENDGEPLRLYQQTYTATETEATLTGTPIEVHAVTTYQPISPANPAGATNKEAIVATVQIEETELATLRESASRVTELENQAKEAAEKRAKEAAEQRGELITSILRESFEEGEHKSVQEAFRTAHDNDAFDADTFRAAVVEASAGIKAANGAGQVNDLSATVTESKTITDEEIINALHGGK